MAAFATSASFSAIITSVDSNLDMVWRNNNAPPTGSKKPKTPSTSLAKDPSCAPVRRTSHIPDTNRTPAAPSQPTSRMTRKPHSRYISFPAGPVGSSKSQLETASAAPATIIPTTATLNETRLTVYSFIEGKDRPILKSQQQTCPPIRPSIFNCWSKRPLGHTFSPRQAPRPKATGSPEPPRQL